MNEEMVKELAKNICAARVAYFARVGLDYAMKRYVKEPSEMDLEIARVIIKGHTGKLEDLHAKLKGF